MSEKALLSLKDFEPITLKEMDTVKLMDRVDTKFVFRLDQLSGFLQELKKDYRVLEVNGIRSSRYETLYYDTPGLRLYHLHQAGKLNRYKVRSRRYVESDLSFFEVKFKSNKGRTIKHRIKCAGIENEITGRSAEFLEEISPLKAYELIPAVWIYYTRITLVNRVSAERLTLDVGLTVEHEDRKHTFDNLVIAEVKQSKSAFSPFLRLMKRNRLSPGSISKYCMGIMHTYTGVKMNNFKPKLRIINKTLYGKTA